MTVKQALKENKLISVIISVFAAGLMAWMIWVTDAAYKLHYQKIPSAEKVDSQIKDVWDDVDGLKKSHEVIKTELKEQRNSFEKDLKEQRDVMTHFQKEILLMFIAIQKEIKK